MPPESDPGWLGPAGTPLSRVGEFGLIARLQALIEATEADPARARERAETATEAEAKGGAVTVAIGDDAAAIRPTSGMEILLTCDIQVDGRHFRRAWTTPRRLGRRCVTVNASDIGAMGGSVRSMLVSLGLGPDVAVEDVEALYRGMLDRLSPLGGRIIGGNITSLESGLLIDVTMIGEVEEGRAVRRDGARAGDLVWATGQPGLAAAGLALLLAKKTKAGGPGAAARDAYLEPAGRAGVGRALGRSGLVTAMIDVSDGLPGDLRHLVEGPAAGPPGPGILIEESELPVGSDLIEAASALGRPPLSFVLGPSDDYELLFTSPRGSESAVRAVLEPLGCPSRPIGKVDEGAERGVRMRSGAGRILPLEASGWDHFR